MSGTTLCPHCDTRFKIDEAQLESHRGMVRCGHCLKAFNARTNFVPEQPSTQLELPILNDEIALSATNQESKKYAVAEESGAVEEAAIVEKTGEPEAHPFVSEETASPQLPELGEPQIAPPETTHEASSDTVDNAAPVEQGGETSPDELQSSDIAILQPMTLAEQVAIVQERDGAEPLPKNRRWHWVSASALLVLVLFAQAAYFFRVDLAARLPGLKPTLTVYCKLLRCSVPLPQKTDLMSIESSDLGADPAHENRVILNVLLRNRAPYAQAFPDMELTLNDTRDIPLARRTFKPKDYLPPQESEQHGLLPNHEISVKLQLGTADIKPTGYRLALHYPKQ